MTLNYFLESSTPFFFFKFSSSDTTINRLNKIKYLYSYFSTRPEKHSTTYSVFDEGVPFTFFQVPCDCDKGQRCFLCVNENEFPIGESLENLSYRDRQSINTHWERYLLSELQEWIKLERLEWIKNKQEHNKIFTEINIFPEDIKLYLMREFLQPILEDEREFKAALFIYVSLLTARFKIPKLLFIFGQERMFWDLLEIRRKIYWSQICRCGNTGTACSTYSHKYTWAWSAKYLQVVQDPDLVYHCGKNMRKSYAAYLKNNNRNERIGALYSFTTPKMKKILTDSDCQWLKDFGMNLI